MKSYAENPAGLKHDLLIVFKGFSGEQDWSEYHQLVLQYSHQALCVSDRGYDIRPYFIVARKFNYRYLCFLNSYSIILDHDWLQKLYAQISKSGVGLAAATGSYESHYTNVLNMERAGVSEPFYRRLKGYLRLKLYQAYFDPFPNYHLRTNAFIISRDLMCCIYCHPLWRKLDAHRFESGKNSLTRQIVRRRLRVLVVGKDGRGYEKEEWCKSKTFAQGRQENLLIADNKTQEYSESDDEAKKLRTQMVWGHYA